MKEISIAALESSFILSRDSLDSVKMSMDDQNLSEELEKLESISGKKTDITSCEHNPFQRRNKCSGRSGSSGPGKCYCPYIKKPYRKSITHRKHSGHILKQATFKYSSSYHNDFKLDESNEACDSKYSKQCSSETQQSYNESDISMNELASYFEILVDIPKQMSTMAEMMYL